MNLPPLRICGHPGCAATTRGSRCSRHAAETPDKLRGSAAKRGYGTDWRKLRAAVLAGSPLCVACERAGLVVAASEVDHIVPFSRGGSRLDRANLQPLCGPCHAAKTSAERRAGAV